MITNQADYDKAIEATVNGKPLLIFFSDSANVPCQNIGPTYTKKVPNYPELKMKKVDVNLN